MVKVLLLFYLEVPKSLAGQEIQLVVRMGEVAEPPLTQQAPLFLPQPS
jgi:hypothetical protein